MTDNYVQLFPTMHPSLELLAFVFDVVGSIYPDYLSMSLPLQPHVPLFYINKHITKI